MRQRIQAASVLPAAARDAQLESWPPRR
jgi:hypothetical protein